jgi:hypothetical protein
MALLVFGMAVIGGVWAWATGRVRLPLGGRASISVRPAGSPTERAPPQPVAALPGDTVPPRADTTARPPDSPLARLDRFADALQRTIRSYGERADQFDSLRTSCTQLAAALVVVDERWLTYSVQGKAQVRGVPLDRARARRDSALYAGVDTVNRHFDGTGCPRP